MKSIITIRDVAKKAGVSETTVSLSFQPNSRISEETRKRVLDIAYELKYVRNSVAQNLRGGRTRTIGFIVNDINDAFYNIMSRAASEITTKYGYQLIFAETGWSAKKAIDVTKMMLAKRVEGFMLSLCEKEDVSLELIRHSATPHVVIDTIPDTYKGSYVINNEELIGEIAGTHLREIGCSRIAFFNASTELSSFSAFIKQTKGLLKSIRSSQLEFTEDDMYFAGITIKDGARTFKKMLKEKRFVYDGIFCANDYVAYGIMNEAEKHGIVIGKDLALIGIDNLEYSGLERISLSSLDIDYNKMTSLAIHALIESIEKQENVNLHVVLEPKLVIRNSTRLFARHNFK